MQWITPLRGRQVASTDYAFRLVNNKAGDAPPQGVIRISEKTMRELRWVVGDKVAIAFHEGKAYLKRVPHGGFSLSSQSKNPKGKAVSCHFKAAALRFPFDYAVEIKEYEQKDGIVSFSLPA